MPMASFAEAGGALRPDTPRSARHAIAGGGRRGIDPSCLIDAVEFDVIPRLLDARRGDNLWSATANPTPAIPVEEHVAPLTELVLSEQFDAAIELIDALRIRGSDLETIYTDLLAASAHRLGEMWEDDTVDFVGVTVGLCVLHQIMYRLSPDFRREAPGRHRGGRALFMPAPQETHFFGVLMAADFFARARWRVWTEVQTDMDRILDLIRQERFDAIGFSVSCDHYLDAVTAEIAMIRRAVDWPIRILVGGRAATANLDRAQAIGADAVVSTAQEGVDIAEAMLDKTGDHA